MSVTVYNPAGAKQQTKLTLAKPEISETAIATVLRATLANDDRQRAKSKTRGEVRGGGRKPFRQKGTGRARAGTRRSPLWRHGGIIFGPTGELRPYKRTTQKTRKAVMAAVLAAQIETGAVSVINATPKIAKSKDAAALFAKFGDRRSTIFVATKSESENVLGVTNLAQVTATTTDDLNPADIARHQAIVFTQAAWDDVAGGKRASSAPAKAKTEAPKASAKKPAVTKSVAKAPAAKTPAKQVAPKGKQS